MGKIFYVIKDNGEERVTAYKDLWDVAQDIITDELMEQYYKKPFTAEQKEYHLGRFHTYLKRDMLNAQEGTSYSVDSSLGKRITIYWMKNS